MTTDLSKNKSQEINSNFDNARKEEDNTFSVTFDGPIMPTKKMAE